MSSCCNNLNTHLPLEAQAFHKKQPLLEMTLQALYLQDCRHHDLEVAQWLLEQVDDSFPTPSYPLCFWIP